MSAIVNQNRNSFSAKCRGFGFSLIELVIVVVIIAIIGAIAIPKMSRGAAGANDAALAQDLSVLRTALDLYATENGGTYPTGANMPNALLQYSDGSGGLSATKTGAYIFGPYLRAVPPMPVGTSNKGSSTFATGVATPAPGTAATGGWYYNTTTFTISANCPTTEKDAAAVSYNTY